MNQFALIIRIIYLPCFLLSFIWYFTHLLFTLRGNIHSPTNQISIQCLWYTVTIALGVVIFHGIYYMTIKSSNRSPLFYVTHNHNSMHVSLVLTDIIVCNYLSKDTNLVPIQCDSTSCNHGLSVRLKLSISVV